MTDAGPDPVTDPPPSGDGRHTSNADRRRASMTWHVAVLALLAYVPAFSAAPGRMPADSKLYLYLDPGRFLADAAGSFDPRQFAGWVPHQHISYLWPTGPWYWCFEQIGVPDWIAHRLWIGTVMLAAGLGVRWCARQLGLAGSAVLVAAVVYQVSLYVLPYVSRTSVMLLPWCGLGWIVGLTVRATRRPGWRDPALIALVVLSVGAVNATALAMIVPAPVLWLVHARAARWISSREALVVVARVVVASLGVSLWWVAGLLVQGRHGAPVLDYSESLRDVASTSTSAEVWRGLGYWLFYVRDPFTAATSASLRYLASTPAIAISYLVPLVGLGSLVWVRWPHRRFAALLVGTGALLAVGVHPIDDRAPLMRLLTGDGEGGLALALRSSTRALPMMSLGLALATGSLVAAVGAWERRGSRIDDERRRLGSLVAGAIIVLVLVNMPALVTGAWVDPDLDRDAAPPAAWKDAAQALDADPDGRVLMLPGAEFGSYRWGHTVDQPIPGLSERGVVTRDLLPLGSGPAMDLLYEFDDRFQAGVAEPESVGPIARLLATDVVWLTNDQAFERYRTARPEIVRDVVRSSDAATSTEGFGAPVVNEPQWAVIDGRSMVDERVGTAAPPVELVGIDGIDGIARAYDDTIVVIGNGAGLVDAAAAGLLSADVGIRYTDSGSLAPSDIGVLVTDTNRRRARQWATSQDTTGFTEAAGDDGGLIEPRSSDARLPVVEGAPFTTAEQVGAVSARATDYGEPVALLAEQRPFFAVDGDPATAWLVGEHGDPVGEMIRLDVTEGVYEQVVLHQPADRGRWIGEVEIRGLRAGGEVVRQGVVLDERSTAPGGQSIALDATLDRLEITISSVVGVPAGSPGWLSSVGFAEIDLGLGPAAEVVRLPVDGSTAGDIPIAWLMTRERVDPMDRWRSDPEPSLDREFTNASDLVGRPEYTVRVDARAPDTVLAGVFDWPVVADRRLTGSLRSVGAAAFDGDTQTAWVTPFDGAVGSTLTVGGGTSTIESVTVAQASGEHSRVTELELRSGDQVRTVIIDAPGEGGRSTAIVSPPLPAGDLTVTITAIEARTAIEPRFGDTTVLPAAIAELEYIGAPRVAPLDGLALDLPCVQLAELDGRPLSASIGLVAGWLDGAPLDVTPCEPELTLDAGTHRLRAASGVFQLDRVVLDAGLRSAIDEAAATPRPVADPLEDGRYRTEYRLSGCDTGCWLVNGYGLNDAWTATVGGRDLGPPQAIDGGFTGWWIDDGTEGTIEVRWTAQRSLTIAYALTVVAILVVVGLALLPVPAGPVPVAPARLRSRHRPLSRRTAGIAACTWVGLVVALAGWSQLPWVCLAVVALMLLRRRELVALTALATVAAVALYVTVNERRWAPPPDFAWAGWFDTVHPFGMAAVATVFVVAAIADDAELDGD